MNVREWLQKIYVILLIPVNFLFEFMSVMFQENKNFRLAFTLSEFASGA